MKKQATVLIILIFILAVGMVFVYDKTSVELAFPGAKATIKGEGKGSKGNDTTAQSPPPPTNKEDSDGRSNSSSVSSSSVKISAGDQSTIIQGNSGPVSVNNEHAQKR